MPDPFSPVAFHLQQLDGFVHEDLILLRWDTPSSHPSGDVVLGEVVLQGEQWPVIAFDSELEVRRFFCRQRDRHVVLLVGAGRLERIPVDIRDRAFERRIRPVTVRDALGAATGRRWCAAVEGRALRKLCEHHLEALIARYAPVPGGAASETEEVAEADVVGHVTDAGLGFALAQASPAVFLAQAYRAFRQKHPLHEDLVPLVGARLRSLYPEDALLLAWCLEEPSRVEAFLVDGARMEAQSAVTTVPAIGTLSTLHAAVIGGAPDKDAASQRFAQRVRQLALEALRDLGHQGRTLVSRYATEIGAAVSEQDYNRVLPDNLRYQIGVLCQRAAVGQPPSPSECEVLREHLFAGDHTADLEALELATRLARFLDARTDPSTDARPADLAVTLAGWYAAEGAFGDMLAKALEIARRGNVSGEVARGCRTLLERFWQTRDGLNQRFAEVLLASYPDALFRQEVVGVQRLIEREVLPAVKEGRRALLLVLDGCPVSDFAALLDELAGRGYGLAAGGWRPGLSLLPSVTEVSRLALLGGQIPEDPLLIGQSEAVAAGDRERKAFEKALKGRTGQLFLKGDLMAGFYRLRRAIEDEALDVVAAVLNSIDSSLTTAEPKPMRYRLGDVDHLEDAVAQGCHAGRMVVVTADHGHTMHRGTELRRGELQGIAERIVSVDPDAGPPEGVVRFSDPVLSKYAGVPSLGLLTRTGEYATVHPRAGYHGGVSLEECVVPFAVLVPGGSPLPRPAWWSGVSTPGERAPEGASAHVGEGGGDGNRLVVTLGGKQQALPMPSGLSQREVQALQLLSRQHDGRLTAVQLAHHLGSRQARIEGMMADLIQKLITQGIPWIEARTGPEGTEYRFTGGPQ